MKYQNNNFKEYITEHAMKWIQFEIVDFRNSMKNFFQSILKLFL